MRFIADTLDDLCRKVFPKLLTGGVEISPTRDPARERCGVLLELRHPLARLSRTETRGRLFSSLGEFLWYLSRDNRLDFIQYYIQGYADESEDGETIHGGYGRRIFDQRGHDQLENVVEALRERPHSRRAVIQIFNAEDISRRYKEVPCTCTLQFLIRGGRLQLLTTMRSNDAYIGLPHDVFCFTMLQELVARRLGIEVGFYRHFVGSLHLYDKHRSDAQRYLDEAVQATVLMPRMPDRNLMLSVAALLEAEERLRAGLTSQPGARNLDPYWADLVRLLQIYQATGDANRIRQIKRQMSFKSYRPYIDARSKLSRPTYVQPTQMLLPF